MPARYRWFLALLAAFVFASVATPETSAPRLLLTPRRLKRLKQDKERLTDRWINFEHRVQTVPDSPERGFELALYYAVTGKAEAKSQANDWLQKHPCEIRQVALIADWTGAELPARSKSCLALDAADWKHRRDRLFLQVVTGEDVPETDRAIVVDPALVSGEELYSLIEYLDATRTTQHTDLRESNMLFFSQLPVQYLLSMRPEQLDHPSWQAHVAALALVNLDPNLTAAQFLQGWGLEDRLQVRDGPGVAYEYLWANPYLPGVSYENMQPWWYSDTGRLLARSDWGEGACWISVSSSGTESDHCRDGWATKSIQFGSLSLVPAKGRCSDIGTSPRIGVTILWKLKPREKITYADEDQKLSAFADAAGLWRLPTNVFGAICVAR